MAPGSDATAMTLSHDSTSDFWSHSRRHGIRNLVGGKAQKNQPPRRQGRQGVGSKSGKPSADWFDILFIASSLLTKGSRKSDATPRRRKDPNNPLLSPVIEH